MLSVVAWAGQNAKPEVSIKIDEQPLTRSATDMSSSFAPVIKLAAPSVVKVMVTSRAKEVPVELPPIFSDPRFRQFFGPGFGYGPDQRGGRPMQRQPEQQGLGSGVIVSSDGYVLTNNHVVAGADEIKISMSDGRELTAKLVGSDPKTDLAVVKVESKDLPAITFADSEKVEVGDRVLAIGNPFGIGQTVTSGMVSGLSRTMPGLGLDYEDFIQTDAAINPGNSGGALVDVKGRLVGINTAILSRTGGFQGIGFAIPSGLARSVMQQLVTNGKVVRGYIGVAIQDINPSLAEQFSLKDREGALIADTVSDSPASKAGLQSGDVIKQFNGRAVKDGRTLKLAVASVAPGTEVKLEVLREGKMEKIAIKVGEQPRDRLSSRDGRRGGDGGREADADEGTLNGVGVADLDARMRQEFDVPARVKGAVITEVDPNSAAAAAGLQAGDVIQEIDRQPVRSAEDAVRLTEKTDSKKTLLRVWNQNGTRFVVVDESNAEKIPAS